MCNYKYIYNINCANFFMRHGFVCKGTGINKETGKTFWCFDKKIIQKGYDMWEEHKENRDNIFEMPKRTF